MLEWAVDDLLEKLAAQGETRITALKLCQALGTRDVDKVTAYLLSQQNKKLVARFEVECPHGHGDFVVSDPSRVTTAPRYCRLCVDQEAYIPDPERIWLAFDFTEGFVQYAKKNTCSLYHFLSPQQLPSVGRRTPFSNRAA